MSTLAVDIVSAENEIFTGQAQCVFATGVEGEFEIHPNHAPLLTLLVPGPVRVQISEQQTEVIFVTGGMLEAQPNRGSQISHRYDAELPGRSRPA